MNESPIGKEYRLLKELSDCALAIRLHLENQDEEGHKIGRENLKEIFAELFPE